MSLGNTHELKTWPDQWEAVYHGWKTAEVRKDDRGGFEVGDVLVLHEYQPVSRRYTGRTCTKRVTHILKGDQFGIEPGYAVLSLGPL